MKIDIQDFVWDLFLLVMEQRWELMRDKSLHAPVSCRQLWLYVKHPSRATHCLSSWNLPEKRILSLFNESPLAFVLGQRLNTTVLKNVTALSEFDCGAHCYQNSCCRSANFRKIPSNDGRENCELLHAVEWEEPGTLQENGSYDYIIMVQPRRVSNLRQLFLSDTTLRFLRNTRTVHRQCVFF